MTLIAVSIERIGLKHCSMELSPEVQEVKGDKNACC